jgi:hypothetical protein
LWAFATYAEQHRQSRAVIGLAAAVLLALATEPAGLLMLAGVLVGLFFARSTSDESKPKEVHFWVGLPLIPGLFIGLLAVILVGSVFLLYPNGLTSLSESLNVGLNGLTARPDGYFFAYPLLISVIYEPVLWVFGLLGGLLVLNGNADQLGNRRLFIGRALIGWLVASVAWGLGYAGANAGHALWFTLPLAGLAAFSLERVFAPVRDLFWRVPAWAVSLHGFLNFAGLFIIGINLIHLGRVLITVEPEFVPNLPDLDARRLLYLGFAVALIAVLYFLVGSIWGTRAALNGVAVGFFAFLALYGANTGWSAAINHADNPREIWQIEPTSANLGLLEKSLREFSRRESGKPYGSEIVVQLPPNSGDDSPLAWLLRHYDNVKYVNSLDASISAPLVIGPRPLSEAVLGGNYVGQDFATYNDWKLGSLRNWDVVAWLYDRTTRVAATAEGKIVLWVRADVYGLQPEQTPLNQ